MFIIWWIIEQNIFKPNVHTSIILISQKKMYINVYCRH